MSNIFGMMMRPCSSNLEEHTELWKTSEFYTGSKFMKKYREHMIAMEHIAECAKIYVLNNWESISEWTGFNIDINDASGEPTKYYNWKPIDPNKKSSSTWIKMNERLKENHNPIVSVTDVVLDPSDGDFSLTINGKVHMWIDDDSIITIADFIEKKLTK